MANLVEALADPAGKNSGAQPTTGTEESGGGGNGVKNGQVVLSVEQRGLKILLMITDGGVRTPRAAPRGGRGGLLERDAGGPLPDRTWERYAT